jgi:hypothetical protein
VIPNSMSCRTVDRARFVDWFIYASFCISQKNL